MIEHMKGFFLAPVIRVVPSPLTGLLESPPSLQGRPNRGHVQGRQRGEWGRLNHQNQ